MPRLPHRPSRHAWVAVIGGVLTAMALPPWGFWPLAFVGVACFETALHRAATRTQRARYGWLFAAAWLLPGMCWMWFLTAPGYLIATALFAGFHALAAVAAPTGTWRVWGRPAAHTLAEALRFCFPFGGVPLASLAIGQAGGPFASVVRIGGVLLLTWFVFQVGFALAGPSPFVPAMVRKQRPDARPEWHGAIALLLALVLLPLSAAASNARTTGVRNIAIVQGGGPQGTQIGRAHV